MDSRTRRVKELEWKLRIARDFILRLGLSSVCAFDENKSLSTKYWLEEAFRKYSETRPND